MYILLTYLWYEILILLSTTLVWPWQLKKHGGFRDYYTELHIPNRFWQIVQIKALTLFFSKKSINVKYWKMLNWN